MTKKLTGSRLGNLVIILAIILIPLMYAGLLTWAYEAPLTRINRLQAAVVNLDQPVSKVVNGKETHFKLGADLSKRLLEKDAPGFGWKKTDLASAKAGLADGTYRALLIIPTNFSEQLSKLSDPTATPPKPAILRLETDDSVNYLAGSMATSVARGMESIVQREGASKFIDQVLVSFSPLRDGMQKAADGANALADGTVKLEDGANKAKGGADRLNDGLVKLKDGATVLRNGTYKLSEGSQSLVVGLNQLASGAVKISNGTIQVEKGARALAIGSAQLQAGIAKYTDAVGQVADGANQVAAQFTHGSDPSHPTLKDGSHRLAQGLEQIDNALANATNGTDEAANGAKQLAAVLSPGTNPNSPTIKDGTTQVVAFTEKLAHTCSTWPTSWDPLCIGLKAELRKHNVAGLEGLAANMQKLDAGVIQAGQGASKLAAGLEQFGPKMNQLKDGIHQSHVGAEKLDQGIDTLSQKYSQLTDGLNRLKTEGGKLRDGSNKLAEGANKLANGIPALTDGALKLSKGADQASNGAGRLKHGIDQLGGGANQLRDGISQAGNGATSLANGLDQLRNGTSQAHKGADKLSKGLNNGAQQIPNITAAQADRFSKVAAGPAQVEQIRNNAVYDNGIGFSPFFLGLGLWIGGIALFLIFPSLDARRNFQEAFYVCMLRSLGITIIFGLLQAITVVLGLELLLSLHAVHLLALIGLCMLASVCFVSVNQACVAALGFRGRFVSVLLLCLQLTTAGATFPIETTDSFLQFLHPLLPMTYLVSSVRNLIAGGTLPVMPTVLVLIGWTIAAWLITAYSAYRRRGHYPMPFDPALAFPGKIADKTA